MEQVGDERIPVKESMRYLGITLDSRLNFEAHLRNLSPKIEGVVAHLSRLLPNVGGPEIRTRRLYSSVIRSMILYGASVWSS